KGIPKEAVKKTPPIGEMVREAYRQSRTNDQLLVIRQIEGVTGARRNDRSRSALHSRLLECECAFGNIFVPASNRLEHEIKVPANGIDRACANIVVREVPALGRVRKPGHPAVKMQGPAVADDLAKWQIELITHHANAEALGLVAGRKHKR